eukprot:2331872-Rhodomonas_salina.4
MPCFAVRCARVRRAPGGRRCGRWGCRATLRREKSTGRRAGRGSARRRSAAAGESPGQVAPSLCSYAMRGTEMVEDAMQCAALS